MSDIDSALIINNNNNSNNKNNNNTKTRTVCLCIMCCSRQSMHDVYITVMENLNRNTDYKKKMEPLILANTAKRTAPKKHRSLLFRTVSLANTLNVPDIY